MSFIISFPQDKILAKKIAAILNIRELPIELRKFPDGETYIRLLSSVKKEHIIIICSLNQPNDKLINLMLLSKALREQGAKKITLVAPYLAYMRQDKIFKEGEVVSSKIIASFLSSLIDEIITIDPHLHRYNSLAEIYSVPSKSLHANSLIASWIKENVKDPVIIGPDSESSQWIKEISAICNTPFIVMKKERNGDRQVKIKVNHIGDYKNYTPILMDDIISTAHTMIEAVKTLNKLNIFSPPICIAVHAIFAGSAYEELQASQVKEIITCNTIPHISNSLDVSKLIANSITT